MHIIFGVVERDASPSSPPKSATGRSIVIRGEVEDTRLEAKAKDTKKFQGQGQGPRTQAQMFSKEKRSSKLFSDDLKTKGLKKFFLGERGLQKIFFGRSPLEENKKRSS